MSLIHVPAATETPFHGHPFADNPTELGDYYHRRATCGSTPSTPSNEKVSSTPGAKTAS